MNSNKKMAELLMTTKRAEQVERVENLIEMLDAPAVVLTIFYYLGEPKWDVLANQNINSKQVKVILQQTLDQIAFLEAQDALQKAALEEQPDPPLPFDDSEPQPPDNIFDGSDAIEDKY